MITLPSYHGPYDVGCHDLEIPLENDRTLLTRLYYPCVASGRKAYWLPKGILHSLGYGSFVGVPNFLTLMLSTPFSSWIKKSSYLNAPLASTSHALPPVVFCHGLAGIRTTYSHICGNLAAKGFVVLAIEHSDGSSSASGRRGYTETIPYHRPSPKDIPEGKTETEYLKDFRSNQLNVRVSEVEAAIDLLQRLQKGTVDQKENFHGHVSDNFDLSCFKGRIDLDSQILAGHSFGGATVLRTLSSLPNHPFKCGVTLDPWMFPMDLSDFNITVPFLTIQSDTFHWKANVEELMHMFNNLSTHPLRQFGMILRTTHNDVSDFSLVFSTFTRLFRGNSTRDPNETFKIVDQWITEYVRSCISNLPIELEAYPAFTPPESGSESTFTGVLIGQAAIDDLKSRFASDDSKK